MSGNNRETTATRTVRCAECNCSSGIFWNRWRAYRVGEPGAGEAPAVAFYCPACADRMFGGGSRRA